MKCVCVCVCERSGGDGGELRGMDDDHPGGRVSSIVREANKFGMRNCGLATSRGCGCMV